MGRTSKTALTVLAACMLSCAVLEGAERGFDEIVQVISDQFHTRPLHIPFFGLVNAATFVARPAGVKHLNLAVFENLNVDDEGERDIAKAILMADGGWRPFVKVHGHAETVLVFMAQDRGDCKLLVLAIESGEATVVELKLNPEGLQAWLRDPDTAAAKSVSR
jgi:hypothetical protein